MVPSPPTSHSAYFVQKAGLPTVHSFSLSLTSSALGRLGSTTLSSLLIVVGACSFSHTKAANQAIGDLLTAFAFVYDSTIGPVTYALIAQLSSTPAQAKTIVPARALYNISVIVVNVLRNHQLGRQDWCAKGVLVRGDMWACGDVGVVQAARAQGKDVGGA